MKVDILGIGGTFMGGVAVLARALGHTVSGADGALYPPMSTLLADQGIRAREGWEGTPADVDTVIIGNALSRGNPAVEAVLDRGNAYTSGAQWLAEHVLGERWVIAVAGTHGKTTTASMIAWILQYAGLEPGFLIGGVPADFGVSARLGGSGLFVVEADEYDTAFFDKRSKFVHFRPRTLAVNNIEYDHADIFPDLAAIQRQFHHLLRTVPGTGLVIANGDDEAVDRTIAMGCWTPLARFGTGTANDWRLQPGETDWRARAADADWSLSPPLPGEHNARNALAALLAARHAGVPMAVGVEALARFSGVRRRLEVRGEVGGIRVVDDFAHHPTAIAATLAAYRGGPGGRVIVLLEPRSNTMRMGVHARALPDALARADHVLAYQAPELTWRASEVLEPLGERLTVADDIETLVRASAALARPGDTLLVMSNGGFGGIHERLLAALSRG